jgi:glyoxylase-like metal-dependent hydrolase (beta-lactamase superfamily II)
MIKIKEFVFNPFQVNTFIVYDETRECLIIDAACYESDEFGELYDFVSANSLVPKAVLNTHGHVDHITGTKKVCDKFGIGFQIHSADVVLLDSAQLYGRTFGFEIENPPQPESFLNDGQSFRFGNSELMIWHTPGHSPGSVVFYAAESRFLITGDVLFSGSIGRTDLPGGDHNQLIKSILSKIMVLPRETKVLPGHGPETSVGIEADTNPFLNRSS